MTPFEALGRQIIGQNRQLIGEEALKPAVGHIRVLGCKTFVHIPKERRVQSEKLSERATEGILVGYEGDKIYRVYIPNRKGGVIRTSTATFDENELAKLDFNDADELIEPSDAEKARTAIETNLQPTTGENSDLQLNTADSVSVTADREDSYSGGVSNQETNQQLANEMPANELLDDSIADNPNVAIKRGRGRPKGSKNKPKLATATEAASSSYDTRSARPTPNSDADNTSFTLLALPQNV